MKKFHWLLVFFVFAHSLQAQQSSSAADIYLGLKKLKVLGSVLYVAAHPDDENTRLITYLSKDRLYRTGYLSLTRGDGGQNLIGDEQGIPLGLIRTQELLAARKIDGGEQFFSRAYDFGFSKTPEETFTKWDRETILGDVVWVIRKFQPDVIITRFPTTGEGGHGHHTASAILANEAFIAAADPKRFPEQLKYVNPWQARRILWNTFNFSGNTPPPADAFKLDVGGYNPVLGKSYGEIAAESRSQHKSQGFGSTGTRGETFEYFKVTGGEPPAKDLFDGVATTWDRIPGGTAVEKSIERVIDSFAFDKPHQSIPALTRVYGAIAHLPESYWKSQKLAEVRHLLEQTSGLWLEAYTSQAFVAQGDTVRVLFSINDRLGIGAKVNSIKVETFDTAFASNLAQNRNVNFERKVKVFEGTPVTQPYWLQQPMKEGYFSIPSQFYVGQPDTDPAFQAVFNVRIGTVELNVTRVVHYKFNDPVKGEQNQPVTVVPPVTVYANPELLLLKKGEESKAGFNVQAIPNSNLRFNKAVVNVEVGKKKLTLTDTTRRYQSGASRIYPFTLDKTSMPAEPQRAIPNIRLDGNGPNYMAMASVRHNHIPHINYFYTDWVKLVPIDLKTEGRRIGYITGAGDKVPEALEQMGYEVTLLGEKELSRNGLEVFDAIITGVRAYNTNEWMNTYYDKLMTYVQNGGNLIVQYNTSNGIGPVRSKMGPYTFNISRNRITDENAAVSFLKPEHPVLQFPNRITQDDFKGWVQERSIYHATAVDAAFQSILRMNDPGESPDDGSLIIAPYGKGYFTYTGLVFFRELPAGVPGAYRLMANLIALNQKKAL